MSTQSQIEIKLAEFLQNGQMLGWIGFNSLPFARSKKQLYKLSIKAFCFYTNLSLIELIEKKKPGWLVDYAQNSMQLLTCIFFFCYFYFFSALVFFLKKIISILNSTFLRPITMHTTKRKRPFRKRLQVFNWHFTSIGVLYGNTFLILGTFLLLSAHVGSEFEPMNGTAIRRF